MSTTEAAVMTTKDVANRFNELAQAAQWDQIQNELYSDDAESIEPPGVPGMESVKGLDAIRKKGQQFGEMVEEMHGGYSGEPIVAGTHFAVPMGMDVSFKGMGRVNLEEIAVYEVRDGKIVKEHFFFNPGK
jgi:hypothetical protein